MTPTELQIHVGETSGDVSALKLRPRGAKAALCLAHGAGAGMEHPFMHAVSLGLAEQGIATLRYQFPYMEAGKKRPDHRNRLLATVDAAVNTASSVFRGLPLFGGGKSMGGRMTSQWVARCSTDDLPQPLTGLVFFGFPLHPAGKPGTDRAEHLEDVPVPMLFQQGTRDTLAELPLIRRVCDSLGARATLEIHDGADHGFHVLKRSGRTDEEVMEQLVSCAAAWMVQEAS